MNTVVIERDQLRLYGKSYPIPVGQSQFSKIKFLFSADWDEFTKIAQFKQGDQLINIDIIDNECIVPTELGVGEACLRVRGTAGTSVIATANELVLTLVQGFESGGTPSVPPTPDLYDDLIKAIKEAEAASKGHAENAQGSADAAGKSAAAADKSAENAQKSAEDAENVQKAINAMQVLAETLPAGTPASVKKEIVEGVLKLVFGIPQGAKGADGKKFVIALTEAEDEETYTADKTFDEIKEAYESHQPVVAHVNGSEFPLMTAEFVADGSAAAFTFGYTTVRDQGDTVFTRAIHYLHTNGIDEWADHDLEGEYIQLLGGTLLGPLILSRDPVEALEAVTKQFLQQELDKKLTAAAGVKDQLRAYCTNGTNQDQCIVSNTGSANAIARYTSQGQLFVSDTPTVDKHAASKKYVDDCMREGETWVQAAKVTLSGDQNELTIPFSEGYSKIRFKCEIVTATSDHFTQIQARPNALPYFSAAEINNSADTSRFFVGECEILSGCGMIKGWQVLSVYARAMKPEDVLCLASNDYPIANSITSLTILANGGSKPIGTTGTVITVWGIKA